MDLNSDLGEGFGSWTKGDDEALLQVVTSASIACGFHAGDASIMKQAVRNAVANDVAIGAHVSYPDMRGFGRWHVAMPPENVAEDILYQLGALQAFAQAAGSRVRYVKAHGALYHRLDHDEELASAVMETLACYDPSLSVLVAPGREAAKAASRAGLAAFSEGYADRAYRADGSLLPRDEKGAVVLDVGEVAERGVALACHQAVRTCDGSEVCLEVDSICVHGDTPGAIEMARRLRRALLDEGVELRPFTPG